MKLTLDTSGGDGADDLLARAYIAAIVGPFRRPHGRAVQVRVPGGMQVKGIADNRTGGKVLFVTVTLAFAGGQAVTFLKDGGGGTGFTFALGTQDFILMPGEQLYAATNPANVFDVFTEAF